MADFDFDGPATIVNDHYQRSIDMADAALEATEEAQQAFSNSVYQAPTISVKWETLPAPLLPDVPDIPTLPLIALDLPSGIPGEFTGDMPDVTIPDFTAVAPTVDYGTAPTLTIGTAPAIPAIRDVAIPDAPEVTLPDAPEFLQLTTYAAPSINLREEWLDKLEDVPTLTLLEPAPFAYAPAARYASQLLEQLKATLQGNLANGTGIPAQAEQAMWARELDRETAVSLAREQEVLRSAEALGFPFPPGVIAGQLFDANRQKLDQLATRSRDIAIKQAELQVANMQATVQQVTQLETVLMDDAYKVQQLAFQAAKETADNAIATHNARIEYFKALLAGYQTYASTYDTLIKAELSKVTLFEALLKSEQTKADINQSLVARYKAEIEGRMAAVEIFKARVGAAQTLVELERTKIQAGAEQVRAFVATINGETAKAELYKVRLEGEQTKMQVYGEQVKAYGVFTGAQLEKARVNLAVFQSKISAKELEWRGWTAKVAAASAQVDAAAKQSAVIMDGYRIGASAIEAKAQSISNQWAAGIQQYSASVNYALQAAKINSDAIMHTNDARMQATQIQFTTSSQRLASSFSAVATSASISGGSTLVQQI